MIIYKNMEAVVITTKEGDKIMFQWMVKSFVDEMNKNRKNNIMWVYIEWKNFYLNYNDIKNIEGKKVITQDRQIEEWYHERTQEERKKMSEWLRNLNKETFKIRKNNFLEERKKILEELKKRELSFDLKPTLDKIEEYNKNEITFIKNALWM